MRLYLPAQAADLAADELSPRWAHTVTSALRAALPDEDEESLEMTATLAAADDSVRLLGAGPAVPRRVVLAADVAAADIDVPAGDSQERLPSAVRLTTVVPWRDVAALLVDEAAAEGDVAAAAAGDDAALERSADRDLLWYDVAERGDVLRELGG